ncbi:MAG: 50S ribosomal protein L9 [Victivallaceae bacterium]|nr:50S ribosomal protein L9 [Victivallaceae bacterium]
MANKKYVLLEDVADLGLAGDEVSVSAGYARNYLIPQGKVTKLTPGTAKMLAARKEQNEKRRAQELADNEVLAAKINETELTFAMQASEDGQLFGSVSARNIVEQLAEKDLEVTMHQVKLDEALKTLGSFEVEIALRNDVRAVLKVQINRAQA